MIGIEHVSSWKSALWRSRRRSNNCFYIYRYNKVHVDADAYRLPRCEELLLWLILFFLSWFVWKSFSFMGSVSVPGGEFPNVTARWHLWLPSRPAVVGPEEQLPYITAQRLHRPASVLTESAAGGKPATCTATGNGWERERERERERELEIYVLFPIPTSFSTLLIHLMYSTLHKLFLGIPGVIKALSVCYIPRGT